MPGLVPPVADERTGLLSYLAQQRAGILYATHGLSDAQAMTRPSVSQLSLGGLVKHAALVEQATAAASLFEAASSAIGAGTGVHPCAERGFPSGVDFASVGVSTVALAMRVAGLDLR